MFDLFRSRDKVVRFLLGALLVLVALSLLTYLIPSYGTGGVDEAIVAEVGKQQLSMLEVQRTIQNTLRGQQVPPSMIPHMVPQVIDGMITERAIAFQAKEMGFEVKPEDVSLAIRNMLPQLFPDGQFVGREQYAAMLAQQNMSIAEFEESIARQILVQRMRDIVLQGTIVTPAEIEQEFRRRNQKTKIEFVKLTQDKLRAQVQPSEEELKNWFTARQAQFQIPEKRNLVVLVLDQAKVEQKLTPPEAELRRMYEQNKDSYRVPERVKVRHILLKTVDKPASEEAAIKSRAEGLLKQIRGGANFSELAKKNSEDPGSAAKGGELGDWVTRGQMVPEFEQAAFTLKPNEISDLVKTQYGYHIVQVLAKEEAHLQSFDEVKDKLAADWKKVRANEQLQNALDNAQAALQKNPQNPEKVASDFGMQLVRAEKIAPGDPVPEVGVSRDFEESVLATAKGRVSQPVAVAGNKVAMALVTEVFPAHPATLEEVRDQVRDAVVREKAEKLASEKANELYQKAASMGDLKKAAQAMGLEVKTSEEFDRQGAVEGLGQASYLSDAFTKPVGTLVGPVTIPDARIVYKVLERKEADPAKLAEQTRTIRDELKAQKARERNALFEDGLRQALIQRGKIKIHQDAVSRLTSGYRG